MHLCVSTEGVAGGGVGRWHTFSIKNTELILMLSLKNTQTSFFIPLWASDCFSSAHFAWGLRLMVSEFLAPSALGPKAPEEEGWHLKGLLF